MKITSISKRLYAFCKEKHKNSFQKKMGAAKCIKRVWRKINVETVLDV